jgi:hypothetical protein
LPGEIDGPQVDGAFVVHLAQNEAPSARSQVYSPTSQRQCGSLKRKSRSPSTVKDEAVANPEIS